MAEEIYHFKLGDFDCITLNEGTRSQEAEQLFGYIPADERAQVLAEFGLNEGILPSAINVLYLDTGSHKILVDTGLGQGALYAGLQAEGLPRESIDTVIITHGHGDHINGILDDDQLAFPNAQYFISEAEWQYWQTENRSSEAQARVLEATGDDHLTRVADDTEFLLGICSVILPGHTPGMMGLLIESGGERMLHIADAAMYALQGKYPDWSPAFDADPEQARVTRRKIWECAARDQLMVMGYHYPQSGRGHVVSEGDHWVWQPVLQKGTTS